MANQLLHVTCLWCHSGRLMNEQRSLHDSQHKEGSLSELSRIMAGKTLKKSVSLTDSEVQTFLEGETTNIQKEKSRFTNPVALVLAFFATENENRQLKDSSLAKFV